MIRPWIESWLLLMTADDHRDRWQIARVGGRMARQGYTVGPAAVASRITRANARATVDAGLALLTEWAHPEWPILAAAWPIDPIAPWHPSDDR